MATKKSTGITTTMIKFGGGISAARALPKAKGKRPAVIILHERYGIDQHTRDLTAKLAQAGFVGLAPDLFHRFTGDRKAVLRGEQRVDLTDEGALADLNAAVDYLKKLKEVDASRIGIIGVCQTGRQPVLLAAKRNDIAGAVVLYGAIGGREWQGNELRPTPIEDLVSQVNCPVLGISAKRIILFRWTTSHVSVTVWRNPKRAATSAFTAMRPMAGSTTPCRAATAKKPPTMLGS